LTGKKDSSAEAIITTHDQNASDIEAVTPDKIEHGTE